MMKMRTDLIIYDSITAPPQDDKSEKKNVINLFRPD